MTMRIDIKPAGGDRYRRALAGLSRSDIAQATAEAINMGAARARNAMRDEMQSVFDRPTSYILRSVQVVKAASATNPNATIAPTYMGGKGIDPQQILAAQDVGGRRRDKRSEVALHRAGILPNGYQTAIPKSPFRGSDDGHGNLKGVFIAQLISYFSAFTEQGYRANMTDRRRQSIHLRGGKGVKFVGPVRGHRFFVTYGSMRGGARWTVKGENDARASNLPPGIWAASGTGGVNIEPVLMFVRSANYKPRISLAAVRQRSGIDELVPRWIRGRVYDAFRKASLG